MHYALSAAWAPVAYRWMALIAVILMLPGAYAHVHWTRTNTVDADTIVLYHFDDATSAQAPAVSPLASGLGLTAFSGATSLAPTADTPGSPFNPQGLALTATQTLRTTDTVTALTGDLTIECWFKWNSGFTTGTLEIGLRSGARIRIARDEANPANDRFGVAGTHGSFMAVPEFTNWADIGDEEAGLNEWRHLALAIHSTGIHYDDSIAHDVYSTGTVGRIYLNGHAVGFSPFTIDLAGLPVHDASMISVIMTGGGMTLDELTVWRRDWTSNGNAPSPFGNGRGSSAVDEWSLYGE